MSTSTSGHEKLLVGDGKMTYEMRTLTAAIIAIILAASPTAVAAPSTINQPAASAGLQTAVRNPRPSTPPQPTVPTALDVLESISVANENNAGYDRDLYAHWSSQGNGCDTRDRVLIDESATPAQVSYPGCAVVAGDWLSTYDNVTTSDPTDLDVDHLIPLAEAHGSGAHAWTATRREAFANDLTDSRTLAAVSSSSNRSKGANDPSNWVPPHAPAVCGYLSDWISVKARWNLSMDQSEHGRIRNLLNADCPDQPIAPTTPPVINEPPAGNCDPSYPTVCIPPPPPDLNCGDIPFRDFVVLQPDPHRFDGNKDGIGCVS